MYTKPVVHKNLTLSVLPLPRSTQRPAYLGLRIDVRAVLLEDLGHGHFVFLSRKMHWGQAVLLKQHPQSVVTSSSLRAYNYIIQLVTHILNSFSVKTTLDLINIINNRKRPILLIISVLVISVFHFIVQIIWHLLIHINIHVLKLCKRKHSGKPWKINIKTRR